MPITSEDFNYIRTLVREGSGLTLDPGKEYLVESRLEPLAHQEGFASLALMRRRLQLASSGDLRCKVIEAMTINETSFFREIRTFDMFKMTILPALLALRAPSRTLRLWCAASSCGQEPYSFAMLMREHFPSLQTWNIQFIASDISKDMLARARAGRFTQIEVNRGLPANLLVKYFQKVEGAWELNAEIRRMVEFRELNLIKPWHSLPRMDVIFMRNVLIYFNVETKKAILAQVRRLLNPDGYLLLGGAETTTNLDDSFEPITMQGATFFRLKSPDRSSSDGKTPAELMVR